MFHLITGGIRSGKSELAERLASQLGQRIAYVATGIPSDTEMLARILRHRERRSSTWTTIEVTGGLLADALRPYANSVDGMLLDELGGLAARLVTESATIDEAEVALGREEQALWALLESARLPAVVVTSEVGLSLVPTSELGRRFADVLGRANQRWAQAATEVTLVVAGLTWKLK